VIKLPWRRRQVSRGQAIVEFALILPVLVLMLMLALDFGRVFFGWVALNNASRIAANDAAQHPEAWTGSGDANLKAQYRAEVRNDLTAINCTPPGGGTTWQTTDVPNPTYKSGAGVVQPLTSNHPLGDHAVVTLHCSFPFLTPFVSNIMGGSLTIGAQADFTIRGGTIAGLPVGNPPPVCNGAIVPNLVGASVAGARGLWTGAGFTGSFTPASGSDTETVLTQTTSPASSPGDCLAKTAVVTVTHTVNGCVAPNVKVPNLVGKTVAAARTAWFAAGFSAGTFTPSSGFDTDVVSAQTTNPSSNPGDCKAPATTVTVSHAAAQCTMPQLVGLHVNAAQSAFTGAGFTGTFTVNRPPNGNYSVTGQNKIGGQQYACTSAVTVSGT
jgi:Flp pilus assembly protein TadG